ncbi:MAG: dihydrofolate reductase family protein, partial [Ilumatobacteraceae bacterium]
RAAGIEAVIGVCADEAAVQLRPYLHHRRTGRPHVVLKLAATLDGRTAAPDGTSQWITGPEARARVHRLRAESGAVVVGSGTVRADDPSLTVRHVEGPDPRRVVLGSVAPDAQVQPCTEWHGSLTDLLDQLGSEGVLQVLIEGGAKVAASFHRERLVDRYVIHLAPALMGGDDGMSMLSGLGTPTIDQLWRGRVEAITQLGADIEVELVPQESP